MSLKDGEQTENLDNQQFERRLWLDYISRQIDRDHRSRLEAGATSWVLVGLLVAIVFKCIPSLPAFLAIPHEVSISLVIFLLEIDIILSLFLIRHMAGSEDISISCLYPRSKRRTDQVAGWAASFVVAILALLHVVAV